MDSLVDLGDVRRLIDIVQRHGLEGLTVNDAEVEVSITADPPVLAQPPARAVAPSQASPEEAAPRTGLLQLKSPITGVFYRSPQPTEPPFLQIGDVIEPEDSVCLIEAMKIFNEIPAGVHGRLVRVAAQNEQLVVSGEVLMEFEPVSEAGS